MLSGAPLDEVWRDSDMRKTAETKKVKKSRTKQDPPKRKKKVRNENYWPGKENFSFPDPAGKDAADFDIKLDRTGTYSLTFTATLFPDDQTCHPGLIASTYLDEGSGPTQATYLESLKYIKDGLPHTYSLKINVTGNSKLHFAGSLYSYENKPDDWAKHLILSAISIRVKYSA